MIPGVTSTPTAELRSPRLEALSLTSVTVGVDADVSNPYPVALPVAGLRYAISTGDAPVLSGTTPVGGTVPAGGTRSLPLSLAVDLRELLDLVPGLRPGEIVDYVLDVTVSVDVPAVGVVDIPLQRQGSLPVPAPPRIEVREVAWEELSLTAVRGAASLGITNPNRFGIDLDQLAYGLTLGGRQVAGGEAEPATRSLAADGTTTIRLPVELGTTELGLALLQTLGGSRLDYAVTLDLGVGTPFGPLRLDLSDAGRVPVRR